VLLVFAAPCQLRLLARPEHGRTIPVADIALICGLLPSLDDSEQFRSAPGTCHSLGGKLKVRQTDLIASGRGKAMPYMKRRDFITLLGGAATTLEDTGRKS
jgi:hypothetical protein